jgi:hypothetical protein
LREAEDALCRNNLEGVFENKSYDFEVISLKFFGVRVNQTPVACFVVK